MVFVLMFEGDDGKTNIYQVIEGKIENGKQGPFFLHSL